MAKIVWAREARLDVENIIHYINSQSSGAYARIVIFRIRAKAKSASLFPYSFRSVPEKESEEIREFFAYSYRIVYRVEEFGITILRVLHQAQDRSELK